MNLEKNIVFLQYITCIYVLCVIYYFYTKKFVVLFEKLTYMDIICEGTYYECSKELLRDRQRNS